MDRVPHPEHERLREARRAPAERGRTNAAVEKLLAETLGVPTASVRIHAGKASAHKKLEIDGLEILEVHRRLSKPSSPG
ncbi:MAG: hypothetical protein CL908_10000 [Deltaproteobacteria bacterium]|nr:hypothetical protein [Deltaproteobacteria bacterium]